jgi:hypothetical protein
MAVRTVSMNSTTAPDLMSHRNKTVAKSLFRQLKEEGFSHQQIIELSTTLLDLVTTELRSESERQTN